MKSKILTILAWVSISYTALSGIYLSLPLEIQELLPNVNWLTALITGGSSGIIGSTLLYVRANVLNAKKEMVGQQTQILEKFLELKEEYNVIKSELIQSNKITETQNEIIGNITFKLNQTINLIKVDLQSKASNSLIDQKVKEIIEGVLNDEQENTTNL